MLSKDGAAALCARVLSGHKIGSQGAGWLHRLNSPIAYAPPPKIEKPRPSVPTDWNALHRQCVEALPDQDDLADQLAVDPAALGRMEYGWHEQYGAYTFPMRDAGRAVIGLRTRFPNGEKRCVLGSRTGIFIPSGEFNGNRLWVCEGPTDCAALLSLGQDAIGRPSNTGGLDLLVPFIMGLTRREIVICADRDPKPETEALTMHGASELRNRLKSKRCVKILRTRYKDVRESIRNGLTRRTLESMAGDAA